MMRTKSKNPAEGDAQSSGVARPGPTRACALPSTSQALPSATQLESCDSTTNQTKVKKIHIYLAVLTAIDM